MGGKEGRSSYFILFFRKVEFNEKFNEKFHLCKEVEFTLIKIFTVKMLLTWPSGLCDNIVFWKNNQLLDWYFVLLEKEQTSWLRESKSPSSMAWPWALKSMYNLYQTKGTAYLLKHHFLALLLTWVVFSPQDNEGSTISRCEADLRCYISNKPPVETAAVGSRQGCGVKVMPELLGPCCKTLGLRASLEMSW